MRIVINDTGSQYYSIEGNLRRKTLKMLTHYRLPRAAGEFGDRVCVNCSQSFWSKEAHFDELFGDAPGNPDRRPTLFTCRQTLVGAQISEDATCNRFEAKAVGELEHGDIVPPGPWLCKT